MRKEFFVKTAANSCFDNTIADRCFAKTIAELSFTAFLRRHLQCHSSKMTEQETLPEKFLQPLFDKAKPYHLAEKQATQKVVEALKKPSEELLKALAGKGGAFKWFKSEYVDKMPNLSWSSRGPTGFWAKHGAIIKMSLNVGEYTQALRYITIHDAWEDGTIDKMCNGNYGSLPMKILDLTRAINKYKQCSAQTQNNTDDVCNSNDPQNVRIQNAIMAKAHKQDKIKKQDNKILCALKKLGFNKLPTKLPQTGNTRSTFITLYEKFIAARNQRHVDQDTLKKQEVKIKSLQQDVVALQGKDRRQQREIKKLKSKVKHLQDMLKKENCQSEKVVQLRPSKRLRIDLDSTPAMSDVVRDFIVD